MGATYKYACPSCGYEAYVAGGKSALMMAKTRTYQCVDCKSLIDLTTEVADPESESGAWPDFIPADEIKCFRCGSHNIRIWDGQTCPRCGSKMAKDKEDFMMVD